MPDTVYTQAEIDAIESQQTAEDAAQDAARKQGDDALIARLTADEADLAAVKAAQQVGTTTPVTAKLPFDSSGNTDNERIAAVNAYFKAHGNETVILPARYIDHSNQIELWSGMKLASVNPNPPREYSRSTVLHYSGPAGTSHIKTGLQQTGQSYPGSGAVRDFSIRGVQLEGRAGTHLFPKHAPVGYNPATDGLGVLWYGEIHDCGAKGYETLCWGYLDGCRLFTGQSHVQGITDTPFYLGGAESQIFDNSNSFMDNSTEAWALSGKPFIRSLLTSSCVGDVMITVEGSKFARKGTAAPVDTPVIATGPNVGAGAVAVGLNTYAGFTPRAKQAKAGQILNVDPRLLVA